MFRSAIRFSLWTMIGVFIGGVLHEFGHCLFYWLQGVPAAMSLTKEFPLRDISINQYVFGSTGGIIFTWGSMIFFFLWQNHLRRQNLQAKPVVAALFLGQINIGLVYTLLSLLKGESPGELRAIEKALTLPSNTIIFLTLGLTLLLLVLFLRNFGRTIKLNDLLFFLFLLFLSLFFLGVVSELDKSFWRKFPSVKVGEQMVYNEPSLK